MVEMAAANLHSKAARLVEKFSPTGPDTPVTRSQSTTRKHDARPVDNRVSVEIGLAGYGFYG